MELLRITIQYKLDQKKELLRTCQSVADQAALETDCLLSQVAEDREEEHLISLTQQWKSWTELNNYFSSDHFRALLGAMKLFGKSYEILINGISQEVPDDLARMNRNEQQVESAGTT